MTDIFSKQKRSEVMSKILGKGNEKTEVRLARLMRAEGIRGWRRHLPIRRQDMPDRERLAVRFEAFQRAG